MCRSSCCALRSPARRRAALARWPRHGPEHVVRVAARCGGDRRRRRGATAGRRALRGGDAPPGLLVDVAGQRTHVVVDGPRGPTTGPVVVFANGLGGAWFDWDRVVRLLPPDITAVRLDRPGLGWTPGPSSMTRLAREA